MVITTRFNSKQQMFLDFVLAQYVKVGVDELAQEKLSPLLRLKYNNAIADAVGDDIFRRSPVTADIILTSLENGGHWVHDSIRAHV